jgi:hypothetical protein
MIRIVNRISLNNIHQLIFVIMECGVFFEVRTEFWNIFQMSFGCKALMLMVPFARNKFLLTE